MRLKVDIVISAEEFALLMFDEKSKLLREQKYHGPDERCGNCGHHEVCGNMAKTLVPWEKIPGDQRETLYALSARVLSVLAQKR